MKISYSWLLEYCKTSLSPEELANRLRTATCEVESIDSWSERFNNIVIGKVLSVEKHPSADKLKVMNVAVHKKTITVVTSVPHVAPNQSLVIATAGAVLYPLKGEPTTIRPAKLRDVLSDGMICSLEELGLPFPSEGILEAENTIKPGSSFSESMRLDDTVLDLEVTPNRPDLLCHLGIAREISAIEKRKLHEPPISPLDNSISHESELAVSVRIEDSKLCGRFSAVCLSGIRIEPSPQWLQSRLVMANIRPVNNVVDVTNYVMMELGQPLHAYDAAALQTPAINMQVRGARKGERIQTLEGNDWVLRHDDIVVTNNGKIVDLAGIMGGKESSISPSTTTVLLEAANFSGAQVRRTSRALGIRTEASSRFEKDLDPELTVTALKRAVYLLQEIAGATIASQVVDEYPKGRIERPRIHVSFAKIQQILGVNISASETKAILHYLGFQIPSLNKSSFDVVAPSWRRDVTMPEDIIEELVRIWGFDRLPLTLPSGAPKAYQPNSSYGQKRTLREELAGLGYYETIHLSFVSSKDLETVGFSPDDCIKLPNPLSEETEFLAPSHLPRFMLNVSGANRNQTELRLFEIGHLFRTPRTETERLSFLLRTEKQPEHLYRQAKAAIAHICRVLGIDGEISYTPEESCTGLESGTVLALHIGKKRIGVLGMVAQNVVGAYKIRQGANLLFVEADLPLLLSDGGKRHPFATLSTFPNSERDLTIIVEKSRPVGEVLEIVENAAKNSLVASYEIADIYTGKPLPDDKKSVTIHFVYNAGDRTLTDTEVKDHQQKIQQTLIKQVGAIIN